MRFAFFCKDSGWNCSVLKPLRVPKLSLIQPEQLTRTVELAVQKLEIENSGLCGGLGHPGGIIRLSLGALLPTRHLDQRAQCEMTADNVVFS